MTNAQSNSVSVIDTATFSVIATVPVGSSPSAVAVTPNGRFAYVTNFFGNSVSVISAASNTVVATGLLNKIQEISAKIDAGQTAAACNQLSSFINQVNGFISNGTLTPAQGQPLIDVANALKTNLGC